MSESPDADLRRKLGAVVEAVRPLHQALIEVVRRAYERTHGRVAGPVELFQLLTTDPFFAWLQPMARHMAAIDEALDEPEPLDAARVADLKARLDALLTEGPEEEGFSKRYLALLQDDPDLVMTHAVLRRAMNQL
jgi:hypothetical protein